jgi:hypothetical protein
MLKSIDASRPTARPKPAADVAVALAVKGAFLLALYLLCFGPAHRVPSGAAATATALIGANAAKESR